MDGSPPRYPREVGMAYTLEDQNRRREARRKQAAENRKAASEGQRRQEREGPATR